MTIYRRLLFFEKVKEGDEVLNHFDHEWTTLHGYSGMQVGKCIGSLTKLPRKFRRLIWRTR